MRSKPIRKREQVELVMAIGLVWGHLNGRQFEEAYRLAKGCLRLWPDDKWLKLMCAYAAAEVLEPVDRDMLAQLSDPASIEWISLVMRRADLSTDRTQSK